MANDDKTPDNVVDLPVQVDLDLDAQEREPSEPFRPKVGGRVIAMQDPEELDWRDLLDVGENSVLILRYALSNEDRDHLYAQDLPGWKLTKLVEGYMKHFNFEEKVAAARRQQSLRG